MTKKFVTIILILSTIVPLCSGLSACSSAGYPGTAATINFGGNLSGSCGLVYIAQEQGFFAKEGLTVNVKNYDTGAAAVGAVVAGEMDIAWSSEFRLVRGAFSQEQISALAVINTFTDQFIIGMKDRGISNISDLKGKRIGVPKNTITEFYLILFLLFNGINKDEVSMIDIAPPQAMEALANGQADAAVVWEPYSGQMKEQLGDKAAAWTVQNAQPGYGVISSRQVWITQNPQIITRFLKALVQAEDCLVNNTAEAKYIIQRDLNYDDAAMSTVWSECKYLLSLDQLLILAMEDEARWMISNGLTTEKTVPNFLDYIYSDGLKAVKPGAISIAGK